ncbi:hypothetical protein F5Y10DRAFT_157290 [Nemania abortiva]|nr:hypothetical protein F5Y10DRAFT_157290 [Nemania abortiva]
MNVSGSSSSIPGHQSQNEGYMETTATGRQQPSQSQSWTPGLRHRTVRKSCDRCHQQKLRCVGSKTSLVPCARCQRVGADCVYSARSSKQQQQLDKSTGETQDICHTRPATPAMGHQTSGLFESGTLHLDEVFSNLPSPWDTMGIPPLADHVLPLTHSGSASVLSMGTGGTFSSSSVLGDPAVGVSDRSRSADSLTRLASVCQTLEAMFKRVTGGPANAGTHEYPVAEVFGAFEGFLRVMTLEHAGAQPLPRASNTPFDEYMNSKQASLAAQCYMLCIKLMVSLSEKMLQNLLTSPLPAQRLSFGLGDPESTQLPGGLGAMDINFAHPNQNALENIRVEDLYIGPTDSFEHALNSIVNMLRVGTRLLGRMELLLEIPPEMAGGTMTSPSQTEQPRVDQQMKRSLAARLVGLTWEHETSVGSKCVVTYFRRYRAAILGLAQGHI